MSHSFHAEHHKIDRPDLPRIIRHPYILKMERSRPALNAKTLLLHRFKMGTARNETNVSTTPGQQRAEIAAEATRSHNRYPHRSPTQLRPPRAVKSMKQSAGALSCHSCLSKQRLA